MFDHISLGVNDLPRSRAFYEAALAPLGYQGRETMAGEIGFAPAGTDPTAPASTALFIGFEDPRQRCPVAPSAGFHVALQAPSRAAVDAFYRAALAAGGRDNGPPGLRPQYHPDYYAAFVLDPDGHHIEAVCFAKPTPTEDHRRADTEDAHPASGAAFQSVTLEHLERLLELVQAYYEYDGIAFERAAMRRGLAELLTQPELGGAWLIQSEGETAGYFVLTFGFDLEFGGRQATITELFLTARHRRRGLGRATLQFVEELLRGRGILAYELQAERDNHEALAFYQRCGFEQHDRIPMSKKVAPVL